jgi:hypothetical protein
VALGALAPEGLPLALFTSGEARWLGVAVDGGAELPRIALLSVPYALQAADAETVAGKPLSAFVLAGEQTGTGADGLTYVNTKLLQGAVLGVTPLASSGTPGYLGVFTNSTDLGNSAMFQTGTSIGVGTTAPLAAFHTIATAAPGAFFDVYSNALGVLPVVYRAARGTLGAPTAVQTDDILGGVAVRGYGATGFSGGQGQVMFKAAEPWTDAAHGTYLQLTTTPLGSATWVERMRIDPVGNVGIGTTTPAQKLSVAGTIESTTGGFKFPDGSVQTMAATSDTVSHNSAFGYLSLDHNTTGQGNAAFGEYTLTANTTGTANSAFGHSSLRDNTTGSFNTAVGNSALWVNTGDFNTAVGTHSLRLNTIGSSNAAFGYASLTANTTGFYNAAFGRSSLAANTTGWHNAAFGYASLTANTGEDNAAFGSNSLTANTTGGANAAFGRSSLAANTTGGVNAAFGTYSLAANTTGTANAAFGYGSLLVNTIGSSNAAFGYRSLDATTTGVYSVGLGYAAGSYNTTGSYNSFLGAWAGPDSAHGALSYATAVGYGATVTQSNSLVLGGVNGTASAVYVGIGTSAPDTTLQVVGDIKVGTSGTNGCVKNFAGTGLIGTCSSDARLKANVRPFEPVLDRVVRLQPVQFNWKAEQFPEYRFGAGRNSGLIAQDVERVFPEMVSTDEHGYKMVNYSELPYLTLAAVKELDAKARTLQAENEVLRAQLAALAGRLARLETRDRQ